MTPKDIPEKFLAHRRTVQSLRVSDRRFNELWADYCEVLETLKPIEGQSEALRRLCGELEADIQAALDKSAGGR